MGSLFTRPEYLTTYLMGSVELVPTRLTQRTDVLVSRVSQATDSLLARYSAIAELSVARDDLIGGRNASTAAATSLQIENHANQMVKAAEDLRTVVREVKEAWILGSRTGIEHEAERSVEEDTFAINRKLQEALYNLGSKSTTREL